MNSSQFGCKHLYLPNRASGVALVPADLLQVESFEDSQCQREHGRSDTERNMSDGKWSTDRNDIEYDHLYQLCAVHKP